MEQNNAFHVAFMRALEEDQVLVGWRDAWATELTRLAHGRGCSPPCTPSSTDLVLWGLTDEPQRLGLGCTDDFDFWEVWRWAERDEEGTIAVWAELVLGHGQGLVGRVFSLKVQLKLVWKGKADTYPRFYVPAAAVQQVLMRCPELMNHLKPTGLFQSITSPETDLIFARLVKALTGVSVYRPSRNPLDQLEVTHKTRCSLADRAELLLAMTKREHQEQDNQTRPYAA